MITDFCVICGTKENLHNHHIVCKKSKLKPISGDIDHYTNLITLCGEHHGWIHGMKPNIFNDNNRLRMSGIAAAKAKGKYKGRPPKIDMNEIKRVLGEGNSISKTAEILGVSMSSVQRAKRI